MIFDLRSVAHRLLALSLLIGVPFVFYARQSLAAGPTTHSPYSLKTFIGVAPTGATKPDDLAVSADGADLWVGYGNGANTKGLSGSSNIVEYQIATGKVLKNLSIPGHTDGLKINPTTGDVWTTQNEDANPTLAIINHTTGTFTVYDFAPTLHGGGYDDLVFSGAKSQNVFLAASSPINDTKPVIVRISGTPKPDTTVTSTLVGDFDPALNIVTNTTVMATIADPDSMTLDPAGELVLDNRGDPIGSALYVVRSSTIANPNRVLKIPLTLNHSPVEVNDTIFVTSTAGTLFITDIGSSTKVGKIYTLTKPYFPPNEVYTAANLLGDVGLLDMNTGVVTPVVTGLVSPRGLAFSPRSVAIAP